MHWRDGGLAGLHNALPARLARPAAGMRRYHYNDSKLPSPPVAAAAGEGGGGLYEADVGFSESELSQVREQRGPDSAGLALRGAASGGNTWGTARATAPRAAMCRSQTLRCNVTRRRRSPPARRGARRRTPAFRLGASGHTRRRLRPRLWCGLGARLPRAAARPLSGRRNGGAGRVHPPQRPRGAAGPLSRLHSRAGPEGAAVASQDDARSAAAGGGGAGEKPAWMSLGGEGAGYRGKHTTGRHGEERGVWTGAVVKGGRGTGRVGRGGVAGCGGSDAMARWWASRLI